MSFRVCESCFRVRAVRFAMLATIVLVTSQSGCTILKKQSLFGKAKPKTTVGILTQSQIDLKMAFAKAAEARGDVKHAISAYEEILQTNEQRVDVRHRVALLYGKQSNFLKADSHYLELLKINPDDAQVRCDYGYSLYLRESWEAAEAQFAEAIASDPTHPRSRVNMGMLLARTGRNQEAMQQFESGGLNESQAHSNIALVAAQQGDPKGAVIALHQSSIADHGNPSANQKALAHVIHRIAARDPEARPKPRRIE